ncbi:MAG: hypothetical protein ACRENE_03700 [Polyangiaceae bacterium]
MRIDRGTYLALVAAIGGIATACSSSPSTTGSTEPDASSGSSGGAGDGGSSGTSSGSDGSSGSSSGGASADGGGDGGVVADAAEGGGDGGCANPCGGQCCSAGEGCFTDTASNKTCVLACTTSTTCPTSAPCCSPAAEGRPVIPAVGSFCLPASSYTGQACRCTTHSDCTGNVCAPLVNASGAPVGPYVCKANDGAPYNGCGTCGCGSGYDCHNDPVAGESYCGKSCNVNADCSDSGAECCKPATCANCVTSCAGSGMCGPC